MSPELIQDSGYTENADVWSLGCICYELAELKSPFRNKEEKMSLMDLFDNITKCNYKPLEAKYSPQLREAIQNMVVVDPTKRWSSEQVYSYACRCLEDVKKPLLDPFIAMDDIYIKLTLLNYESSFCKAAERKPINRLYFALEDQNPNEENGQLNYFLELAYWIMALSKPDKKKDKLAVYTKTLIDWSSAEAACKKLLNDLSDYGLKGEDGIAVNSIRNVFLLLSKGRVTERAFAIYSIKFSPENSYA
jgi:serine/threonine protein kinase